jgi:hypothetical protein
MSLFGAAAALGAKLGMKKGAAKAGAKATGAAAAKAGSAIHGLPPVAAPLSRLGRAKAAWKGMSPLEKMWAADAAANLFERTLAYTGALDFPTFTHVIVVSVVGGPQADMRRVWYLACAAAFGRYRYRVGQLGPATVNATWDITGKAVQIEIEYTINATVEAAKRVGESVGMGLFTSGLRYMQQGPTQVTIGGGWPAFLLTTQQNTTPSQVGQVLTGVGAALTVGGIFFPVLAIPGLIVGGAGAILETGIADTSTTTQATGVSAVLPIDAAPTVQPVTGETQEVPTAPVTTNHQINILGELPRPYGEGYLLPWDRTIPKSQGTPLSGSVIDKTCSVPVLPDDGRVITTGEKLDPRVQSPRPVLDGQTRSSLVILVAQALSSPGYLPDSPPATENPLWAPGVYAYNPGTGLTLKQVNGKVTYLRDTLNKKDPNQLVPPTIYAAQTGVQLLPKPNVRSEPEL